MPAQLNNIPTEQQKKLIIHECKPICHAMALDVHVLEVLTSNPDIEAITAQRLHYPIDILKVVSEPDLKPRPNKVYMNTARTKRLDFEFFQKNEDSQLYGFLLFFKVNRDKVSPFDIRLKDEE